MSETNYGHTPTRGRPFQPGQSGNPKGRPAGSRHAASLVVEKLFEGEVQSLTRKFLDKAHEGDMAAMRLYLERIYPRCKDRVVNFDLPPITSAEDAELAGAGILSAAATGVLTPAEAAHLMTGLVAQSTLIEAGSYGRRLAALEAARQGDALQ